MWGKGTKKVKVSSILSPEWKINETVSDINEGRLSKSSGPPVVAKFSNRTGYILVDGHHRMLESHQLDHAWVEVADFRFRAEPDTKFMSIKRAYKLFRK